MRIQGRAALDGTDQVFQSDDGRIQSIEPLQSREGPFVFPGFIDIQMNGMDGIAFNQPDLEVGEVEHVTRRLWQDGVAYYCPTLTTESEAAIVHGLKTIATATNNPLIGKSIVGIHLEGPYLSGVEGPRGAHPPQHARDPDWDEFQRFQEAAGGRIRLVTLAPELRGAVAFIRRLNESGVCVAIGHTNATEEQVNAAVDAGAKLATHLGNAAHDQLQRHHNYVYAQLANDNLAASLIVDGHHLPPDLVKIFVRAKGKERCVLVSDATQWSGLPPGVYPWGHCEIEVRADGWVGVVGQPRLAGSGLLLRRGVENVTRFAAVGLDDAVAMVTRYPARLLDLSDIGVLAEGKQASYTVCGWDDQAHALSVQKTVLAGETVFARRETE